MCVEHHGGIAGGIVSERHGNLASHLRRLLNLGGQYIKCF